MYFMGVLLLNIHEGTITRTLIKIIPKLGTVNIIQGTLSGTFGQENKTKNLVYNIIDKRNVVLEIRNKNGKLSNFGI